MYDRGSNITTRKSKTHRFGFLAKKRNQYPRDQQFKLIENLQLVTIYKNLERPDLFMWRYHFYRFSETQNESACDY